MVDPVGTGLGVAGLAVGLAALFTSCLDVWDFVDAGKAHASNFSLLRTKLDNQRILFIIWGKKLGFGSPNGYDKRLDDPFISSAVEANLNHIQRIFSDTDTLAKRYGIKIIEKESRAIGLSVQRSAIFQRSYKSFLDKLRADQNATSIWKVTRWSIRDEKKFDTMVNNLAEVIDGLDRITAAFISQLQAEVLANEAVGEVVDPQELEEIQEAAGDIETIITSAASIRQRALEARTVSDWSIEGSFYTAPSHSGGGLRHIEGSDRILETGQREVSAREEGGNRSLSRGFPADENIRESTLSTMEQIMLANKEVLQEAVQRFETMVGKQVSRYTLKNMQRQLDHLNTSEKDRNQRYFTWAPLSSALNSGMIREILGTIVGPRETPYHDGIFHIRINLPNDHPMVPPVCWFLTKIYHPNIDNKGAICLDVLRENYSPALRLDGILVSICSLLDAPGIDDPLVPEIALQYLNQRDEFNKTAREWTELYAKGEIIYPGDRVDGFYNTTG